MSVMSDSRVRSALLASFLLTLLFHSMASAQEFEVLPSPQIGELAPALGQVHWRHLKGAEPPKLSDLRGKVVVVQTWVWFCDS